MLIEGTKMYYTMYAREYYIRVDSGEDDIVRKVNVNKEEVYAQTTGGSAHLLSLTDAVISLATDSMSTLCQCDSELC